MNIGVSNFSIIGVSLDSTPLEKLRERRSLGTQQRDNSHDWKRLYRNIVKPHVYRDEDSVKMHSCFFARSINNEEYSSFEEAREVRKKLLRF